MDHLPTVEDPAYPPLEIPCVCLDRYPFDGDEWSSFPIRMGFNKSSLIESVDQRGKSRADTAALLQSWLFFGMLAEILVRPINVQDFVRFNDAGHPVITTILLPHFLLEWQDVDRKIPREAHTRNRNRAIKCLEEVSGFLVQRPPSARRRNPLSAEMQLSIISTAEYLNIFGAQYIWNAFLLRFLEAPMGYRPPQDRDDPEIPTLSGFGSGNDIHGLVQSRLSSWCAQEKRRLLQTYCTSTLFVISNLKRERSDAHRKCTQEQCFYYQIDETEYETRHSDLCPDCAFIGPDEQDLVNIIEMGKIPLVSIERDGEELRIHVVKASEKAEFTAVSHVWGDGLGNTKETRLPTCQLKRLLTLAEDLNNKALDLTDNTHRELKQEVKLAETMPMPASYKGRRLEFVEVFDSLPRKSIMALLDWMPKRQTIFPTYDRQKQEPLAEIVEYPKRSNPGLRASEYTTPLSPEITGGLRDLERSIFDTDEMKAIQPDSKAEMQKYLASLPERQRSPLLWIDTLCIPHNKQARAKAIGNMGRVYKQASQVMVLDAELQKVEVKSSAQENSMRIALSGWSRRAWTLQEGLLARELKVRFATGFLDIHSQELFSQMHVNSQSYEIVGKDLQQIAFNRSWGGDRYAQLMTIIKMFRWRSLSKPDDEALVLAVLLGMDGSEIQKLAQGYHADRMLEFWCLQRAIPRGLLVCGGTRLTKEGFRWAPRSLLHLKFGYFEDLPPRPAFVTPSGLSAECIGWIFSTTTNMDLPFIVVDKVRSRIINVAISESVGSGKGWITGSPSQPQRYGVITMRQPPRMRDTSGILLSVSDIQDGVYHARYECDVFIGELDAAGMGIDQSSLLTQMARLSVNGWQGGTGSGVVVNEADKSSPKWLIR